MSVLLLGSVIIDPLVKASGHFSYVGPNQNLSMTEERFCTELENECNSFQWISV
jgi:hypothetical protein